MTRLLMLDFDRQLVTAVTRALAQEGVFVVGSSTVEDALQQLDFHYFDAALIDCDMIDGEELSRLSLVPVILTTAFFEPEGGHRFFGQARLLRKPFTSGQLLSALHEACGALGPESVRLLDVLRRAHDERQTLALSVGGACVYVEDGELVHAELGEASGEQALERVLAQSNQRPVPAQVRAVVRTIHRPFRALMLDLLRGLEERERVPPLASNEIGKADR